VEQVEERGVTSTILLVQRTDAIRRRGEDGVVARHMFARRVDEIGEQREVQMRVAVRQELHLEMLDRLTSGVHVSDQRRDNDRGAPFTRNPVLAKLQLRHEPWPSQQRDQLIHDADADFTRRYEP
jgi:hypothetical protein